MPLLLCSESGGEGRNLQFCNTLINFDIPWNPMAIEQRIGRIDRIGQTREVYVFNLATAGTIEDAVLRILDEKINMFELVVGEVGAILGEFEEQQDFSTLVLDAWLQGNGRGARTPPSRSSRRSSSRRGGNMRTSRRWTRRCSAMSSMPPEMGRMQGFVAALLARDGALVDAIEPEGLEVLATPHVQQALALPELCRLGFGAALPSGARRVGIETEWLDRFDRLLGDRGRWGRLVLRPEVRAPVGPGTGAWRMSSCWTTQPSGCLGSRRPGPAIWCSISASRRFRTRSARACCGSSLTRRPARCRTPCSSRSRPGWRRRRGNAALPDEELPPAWDRRRVLDLVAEALPSRLDATLAPFPQGAAAATEPRPGAAARLSRRPPSGFHAPPLRAVGGRSGAPARGAAGRGDRARIPRQDR